MTTEFDISQSRRIINMGTNRSTTMINPLASQSKIIQFSDAVDAVGAKGLRYSQTSKLTHEPSNPSFQRETSLPNLREVHTPKADSTPQHIAGLTEWLRSEYHRKFGCFINGAR
jgi:hypothetical protein